MAVHTFRADPPRSAGSHTDPEVNHEDARSILAFVAVLAACGDSPTAPELARSDNGWLGSGHRDGDGEASTSSILLGGGTRTDEPGDPGDVSTSSSYMGGGTRTDAPAESASASSVYMGGGNRDGEPAERNPLMGGGGS